MEPDTSLAPTLPLAVSVPAPVLVPEDKVMRAIPFESVNALTADKVAELPAAKLTTASATPVPDALRNVAVTVVPAILEISVTAAPPMPLVKASVSVGEVAAGLE